MQTATNNNIRLQLLLLHSNRKTTLPPLSVDIFQIRATFLYTLHHANFTFAHPLPRVVVTFVGFLRPIGVAYLSLQIAFFRLVKIQKAFPIRPLCVGVDIHLHNPVRKSQSNIRFFRSGTTVKNEEKWKRATNLLSSILLKIA